ncbi:putative proteasome-type protease [Dyadobacter soli]|uniref:Putative proteasome-type protease n=1 Tax=Dyadobacter soli TaxID=659014 RepID=A0A1G7JB73_9BACT|nr:putative proteasome-type protease [Dyadobacter soli]
MTYCLGIKVASGLVAIADTRLTSGTEVSTNKKVSVYQSDKHSIFIMTSGLRSVRDKAITYFKEVLEERDTSFDKLYKAVNALGQQVRRVADEDRYALNNAGLIFNLFAIVGGQLEHDSEHKLFLLYPEGNWVEVGDGSPFIIIGNSGYGKPLLYRSLNSIRRCRMH